MNELIWIFGLGFICGCWFSVLVAWLKYRQLRRQHG